MQTIGQTLRTRRESMGLLLRQVAAYIDIDQAILSKIERNERMPTKKTIMKLADVLEFDSKQLLIQFMSEKIANEIAEEECASQVLEVAQQKVKQLQSKLVKN